MKKTPDDWCKIKGIEVLDPDGWRGEDGRPWADPISEDEFALRMGTSTVRISKRVPIFLYGQEVGWLHEKAGKLIIDLTDEEAIRWVSKDLTRGLSIDYNRYGD